MLCPPISSLVSSVAFYAYLTWASTPLALRVARAQIGWPQTQRSMLHAPPPSIRGDMSAVQCEGVYKMH